MKSITFFDTEIEPKSKKILDIGGVKSDGNIFHSNSLKDFADFLNNTEFICGHNIIRHDLKYIQKDLSSQGINHLKFIDTLFLSPLLFPTKPYHRLLKDDKIQTDELNNPVNDSQKAKDLFFDEITAFNKLDDSLKQIYYLLLNGHEEFLYFFEYISFRYTEEAYLTKLINEQFQSKFCSNAPIEKFIDKYPIEFANLSEGEQQFLAVKGAIELLRGKETLFLLDEPDTYLHPDWQRDLMDTLNDGSYKDHFLMTTHSPQVIGKVHSENIVILQNGEPHSINSPTINRDSNSILEEIFDVTKRPVKIEKDIKVIFDLLSQNKIDEALEQTESLKEVLDSKDPVFLKISATVKRRKLLGK